MTLAPRRVSFIDIWLAVANRYALTLSELIGPCRRREFARPRQLAMWLCREMMCVSYPRIGQAFGRDHATVIHACRTIDQMLREKPKLRAAVVALSVELTGEPIQFQEILGPDGTGGTGCKSLKSLGLSGPGTR